MNIITQISLWLQSLDPKELYRYFIGIILALIIIIGGLMYRHISKVSALRNSIAYSNQLRKESKKILEQHEIVKQQQQEVDTILAQDKNFKILEYFTLLLKELNLSVYSSKEPIVSQEDLNNGYIELRLDASFTKINMKQLCELLDKIERNERIYTKALNITKTHQAAAIDVAITIATLQKKETSA